MVARGGEMGARRYRWYLGLCTLDRWPASSVFVSRSGGPVWARWPGSSVFVSGSCGPVCARWHNEEHEAVVIGELHTFTCVPVYIAHNQTALFP